MARTARATRQQQHSMDRMEVNDDTSISSSNTSTSSSESQSVVIAPFDHLLLAADECKECIEDDPESENCIVCTGNFTAVNETQCCGNKCICTACYK